MRSSTNKHKSIFDRNPKTTIILTVITIILVLDLALTRAYNSYLDLGYLNKKTIVTKHDVYHHTFKKSKKAKVFNHKIYTNSLGFKDKVIRDVDLLSPNYRILFMGDSFTEGIWLDYEDTFVGMIDSALSKISIEVLNAGRSSYSPVIYWRKIKYLIENVGLNFNEVVVFLDLSDYKDEASFYDLTDELIVVPRNKNKDEFHFNIVLNKKVIHRFILNNTTVFYFFANLIYDTLHLNTYQRNQMKSLIKPSWDKQLLIERELNQNNREFVNGVSQMKKYMTNLAGLLKEHDQPLTIAIYPHPKEVFGNPFESWVNIWTKWAHENDIDIINYFPDFIVIDQDNKEKLKTLKKYYITKDVHFNKEGNRVIANKFIQTYLDKE